MGAVFLRLVFFYLVVFCGEAIAQESDFGWRPGYVSSVDRERTSFYEDVELPDEKLKEIPNLNDLIFDEKITKEFRTRYSERFGQSSAEVSVFQSNTVGTIIGQDNQTLYFDEDNKQRREFGEYMGRRLTEYHIDNYAKSDPDLKPAYQLKEKLSKVKLEVSEGYSFNGKYSLSDQLFDVRVKNPYADVRFIYDLSPDPRVVGEHSTDARLFLGYDVSKKLYFEVNYGLIQGDTTLVWRRDLTRSWRGSLLLTSSPYHELEIPWEKRFIAGVSRSY